MGSAISISANNGTSEYITRLWCEVAMFELEPSMIALNYPPHFTFAIYDRVESKDIQQDVQGLVADTDPIRVAFDKINYFESSPLVLWASPKNRAVLDSLHTLIHSHIDPAGCREHYRPEQWVPHCTLGTQIADRNRPAALEYAARTIEPFDVLFDCVDIISFPPVMVTHQIVLG